MKHYLVIGAGIAGCTAAAELARLGHRVTLLESSGRTGGKVLSYACKATDSCSRCGVCVAHARIAEAVSQDHVTLLRGASVQNVEESHGGFVVRGSASNPRIHDRACTACGACIEACPVGALSHYERGGLSFIAIDYSACLLHSGKSCTSCRDACLEDVIDSARAPQRRFTIRVDGIVVATGHETFSPVVKPRLGYGRIPGVMTGLEAEEALRSQSWLPRGSDQSQPARSVGFIQCVGSRDPGLNRSFCSAVCCAYALRMARLLKSRDPEADIAVYFIDVQNFDKMFTSLRAELERTGIRFVRGIPSFVERAAGGRLSLGIEDPAGRFVTAEHDTVVLSTGIEPTEGSRKLAELLRLERDASGFLRRGRPGVQVAGTCTEPLGILESISSARAAALEMAR